MQPNARTPLEPISAAVVAVALFHLLGGLVLWRWLDWQGSHESAPAAVSQGMHWFAPGDFAVGSKPAATGHTAPQPAGAAPAGGTANRPSNVPPEPVALASLVLPQLREPREFTTYAVPPVRPREPNKFVTLSPVVSEPAGPPAPPKPYKPVPSLLDIAVSGSEAGKAMAEPALPLMDIVDDAVVDAYFGAWKAPPIQEVAPHQRQARLEISIRRDGSVSTARISAPSGSPAMDASVLVTASRVTRIPVALPAGFARDSYDLQINFQIE